ncbi:hypothetical protein O7598_22110 [Micromonospora sp. WMMC241]|uniref:hypothetical protein n=1 Tax=Micromonospora sp. WMMC241 TaxID=3015159 RepID=UPI0022B6A450|nr:hypothetical protein [Micromonospora sp. WMMC241]MCZ7439120.1 hypothetical protein [Micromonospora sp. WMMC241]
MTDHRSAPDPHPADPTGRDGYPDWLHRLEREIRPSLALRLRIWCRRRARRLVAASGALLLLTGLLGAGAYGYRQLRRPATASPAAGTVTGSPASPAVPTPDPGVFAGTPAATWPAGAAGITLPPARPTDGFTAAEVSAGLARVRAAMLTARLDRAFMTGDSPTPLLRHFAPAARDTVRKDWSTATIGTYATRVSPDVRLTPDQPRAKGAITYRGIRDAGGARTLEVTSNVVWVYGFRDLDSRTGRSVVLLHDEVVWRLPRAGDVVRSDRGLWLHRMSSYGWGVDCDAIKHGLVRPGRADPDAPPFPEDPDRLYDPAHPIELPVSC